MRYRKSIKICKGVKLNLSKSGISMTTGVRGLSVSTGSRGTYVNASIPGTGLSTRKKIGGGSGPSANRTASRPAGAYDIHMDDDGKITISQNGTAITDDSLLRKIKQTPEFKAEKSRLDAKRKSDIASEVGSINNTADQMIHIIRMAERVHTAYAVERELQFLKPETYTKRAYPSSVPDKEQFRKQLEDEAQVQISSFAFWNIKKKRMQYVDEHIDERYNKAYDDWKRKKESFDNQEDRIAEEKNLEYLNEYERKKAFLSSILSGDASFVEHELDAWLEEIQLPLDFSVQYEYNAEKGFLYIDLDLPEIDDLPDETAVQLSCGTMKMKKKSQATMREEYAQCVFGFAVFISSHCFNISTAICKILISGYTQRRNKDGDMNDDYIYSIVFIRPEFENKSLCSVDPIEFCMAFQNRCNVSKTHVFKTINPFDAIE